MSSKQSAQPYLYYRLSSFYLFFFATLGIFVPYWPVYLKSLGFHEAQIGELMAIVMVSKLIAPYFLGWLSDHFQKSLVIIKIALLLSIITFSGVLFNQNYAWLVIVMLVFGFAWNASLPLFEALTLNHLEGDTHRYSLVRLWGSVGFIAMVAGLPIIIAESEISQLPYIMLALLIANGTATLFVKEKANNSHQTSSRKITEIIKNPVVFALLLACALQAISHGTYYTFFSLYLEENNYSRRIIGLMWALGVLAEVGVFLVMHLLLKRFSAYQLFTTALFITAIRWVLLALWVENTPLLIFSQLLHAASFGLFHASTIYLIHELFPGRLQMRGQALYAGISFGLGGALGNLLSGYLWNSIGSMETFFLSAGIALIGALIALFFVKEHSPIT